MLVFSGRVDHQYQRFDARIYISFIIIFCLRLVIDPEKFKIHLGLDTNVTKEKISNSDPNPNLSHFNQRKLVNIEGG